MKREKKDPQLFKPMPISSVPFGSKPCAVIYRHKIFDQEKLEKIRQEFNRKIFKKHFGSQMLKRDLSRTRPKINICEPKENEEDSFMSLSDKSSEPKVSKFKARMVSNLKNKHENKENYSFANRTIISPKHILLHSRNRDIKFKSPSKRLKIKTKLKRNLNKKKRYLFETISNSRSELNNMNEQTFMQNFITKTNPKILLSECFDRYNKISNGKLK